MLDWLAIWGVGQATVFVFRPVMEEFAKDVANDAAKSYVGRGFQKVFSPLHRQPLTKATGLALKELLELIQNEMLDAEMSAGELRAWLDDVRRFVGQDAVLAAIRELFLTPGAPLDPGVLAAAWQGPETPRLPDEFSWARVAKRFARKVGEIRSSTAELKETFDALAAAQGDAALRELAGLPPEFDLETYREALIERYGNVSFDSLDTSGASYNAVRLWNVFTPQSARATQDYMPQLFELPKEQQQRLVARGELDGALLAEAERLKDEWRRGYFSQPLRPVLEVCADASLPLIVVLGDPGAGKSSLLRWLALEWARTENATARYATPLPLLIELRDYNRWECASGKSFVRYLHDSSTWHRLNQQTLHHLLQQPGRVVLLLDGLDEVFDPVQRERVVNDIHRFSNEYKTTRMILTSRVVGYQPQRLRDAGFKDFMLQDLDPTQIEQFLERWHSVTFTDANDARQKLDRLNKAIRDSRAIAQLAGNPLLLTMMAILNRYQELPRDRAELYSQAARVLLHQWDTERALNDYPELRGEVDLRSKQELLRLVARAMQSGSRGLAGNIIGGEQLEALVEGYLREQRHFAQARAAARALVRQLRERNFILCFVGADSYAFVHRTFLEYFCAADFVQRFNVEQSLDLDALKALFAQHASDENWREVLRLICAQIDEQFVGQLVAHLADQIDLEHWNGSDPIPELPLALYCLSEARNLGKFAAVAERLLDVTRQIVNSNDRSRIEWSANELLQAYRAIGTGWPGRTALRNTVLSDLKVLNKNNVGQVFWPPLLAAIDCDRELIQIIACSTEYPAQARASALVGMAQIWQDEQTRRFLGSRAINDTNWYPRNTALEALAGIWPNAATRALLEARAVQDADISPRRTALQALANNWPDAATYALLESCARQDEDTSVRNIALSALADYWPDAATRALLENYTSDDVNAYTRRVALQMLAKRWPNDTTRTLLEARAVSDKDWLLRLIALGALIKQWPDAATRTLLEARANNDPAAYPRRKALDALVEHWPDERTQAFVKQQSSIDDNAAHLLAQGYSTFGGIVFTRNLNNSRPYLNPSQPISREHIEAAAAKAGIVPADIDEAVRGLSAHMGWDITQGSGAELPGSAGYTKPD
jgi:hypothetical protein